MGATPVSAAPQPLAAAGSSLPHGQISERASPDHLAHLYRGRRRPGAGPCAGCIRGPGAPASAGGRHRDQARHAAVGLHPDHRPYQLHHQVAGLGRAFTDGCTFSVATWATISRGSFLYCGGCTPDKVAALNTKQASFLDEGQEISIQLRHLGRRRGYARRPAAGRDLQEHIRRVQPLRPHRREHGLRGASQPD
jgi:hypothetical protein